MPHDILPGLRRALGGARSKTPTVQEQLPYKRVYLRAIDIFRDLPPEELRSIETMTRMTTVPKGSAIYHQEEHAEGLFLLKKGRVRLSRTNPSGKKLDLVILEPGTFFGEMPLLGERMRNADAEALEDCTLCVMSQADVERLLLSTPRVALRMLEILGRRLAESEARLEDLAYRGLPARLASLLLRLGENRGDVIEGVTHQELGDMLGVYRETITKTLDEFQSAGYIELARRRIRVLDREGLSGQLHE